MNTAGMYSK
ncbi:Protein of unknown function [Bacillus wiedmannii]|nr:Protein of unknown function [Bacillus wiedmannii]